MNTFSKTMLVILALVIVAIFLMFLISISPIGIWWLAVTNYPDPPEPEIKYGEFPISVTYEINGETAVIEDTVICEFDGFETLGEAGKYRKWKSHLKSGNENITLLKIDDTAEIFCNLDSPEYYMGDLRYMTANEYEKMRASDFKDNFLLFGKVFDGKYQDSGVSLDTALQDYGLKIISVKTTPPIQNNFK